MFLAGLPLDLFSFKGTDLAEAGISRCFNFMARPKGSHHKKKHEKIWEKFPNFNLGTSKIKGGGSQFFTNV